MGLGEQDTELASSDADADSVEEALRELAAAPDVDPTLDAGETIGGSFRIERELGKGGMGVVYLAWDAELERLVALKVQRGGEGTVATDRLAREARAMARLSHPNVLPVHEVGEHEGRLFIAMEYVEGGTATQWLEREPRQTHEIVDLYAQAADGLAAAHAIGLVHRDFKPDNVLVGEDGRARVADFGLARVAGTAGESSTSRGGSAAGSQSRRSSSLSGKLTQTGARVGTIAYMAPEQHGSLDVDARADQFSFCVALFEALFGQRPFLGKTTAKLLHNIHTSQIVEPDVPRTISKRVMKALRRGLRPDPEDRFPTMQALRAALGPRPFPGLPPQGRSERWRRRLCSAGTSCRPETRGRATTRAPSSPRRGTQPRNAKWRRRSTPRARPTPAMRSNGRGWQ